MAKFSKPSERPPDAYELRLYHATATGLFCYRVVKGDKSDVLAALEEGGGDG